MVEFQSRVSALVQNSYNFYVIRKRSQEIMLSSYRLPLISKIFSPRYLWQSVDDFNTGETLCKLLLLGI